MEAVSKNVEKKKKNVSIFLKETEGPSSNWHHGYFLSDVLTIK